MELKWKKSEQVEGSFEANLAVTLISVGETTQENKNGTVYHVGSVTLDNGKNVSAIIYEKNFNYGVTPGTKYLAKAIYDPKRGNDVLIQMSHLVAAERANIADLGFSFDEVDELAAISKEAKKLETVK